MQQKSGNQYDTIIKDLFAGGTEELINFFSDIPATVVSDLKIEFPQVETRISDLVVKAKSDQGAIVIHLEFQSRNDDEMPYRMLRYALEIHKTYHLPVYQMVIYFGQWEMNMAGQLHYRLGNENMLDYRYRLVGDIRRPGLRPAGDRAYFPGGGTSAEHRRVRRLPEDI